MTDGLRSVMDLSGDVPEMVRERWRGYGFDGICSLGLVLGLISRLRLPFGERTLRGGRSMKRNREVMNITWQTPANPPERHDYIFRNGNILPQITYH